MHSWKYKKIKNEQRKARRRKRQMARISHANKDYMDDILQGKSAIDDKNQIEPEFLKRMKILIWRSVFRSKV